MEKLADSKCCVEVYCFFPYIFWLADTFLLLSCRHYQLELLSGEFMDLSLIYLNAVTQSKSTEFLLLYSYL